MAQLVSLPSKHEDLDLIPRTHIKTTTNQNPKVDIVDCAYDPSIVETDKQQMSRTHWPSQPSLLSELQRTLWDRATPNK